MLIIPEGHTALATTRATPGMTRTDADTPPRGPRICVARMMQLAEAVDDDDDWTGTADPRARGKTQTRLATRAWRKRRKAHKQPPNAVTMTPNPSTAAAGTMAKATAGPGTGFSFPLAPDHLIKLLQYNVMRAMMANSVRPVEAGLLTPQADARCESGEWVTLQCCVPPPSLLLSGGAAVPPAMYPTALQQTVPHPAWMDLYPHPMWA